MLTRSLRYVSSRDRQADDSLEKQRNWKFSSCLNFILHNSYFDILRSTSISFDSIWPETLPKGPLGNQQVELILCVSRDLGTLIRTSVSSGIPEMKFGCFFRPSRII